MSNLLKIYPFHVFLINLPFVLYRHRFLLHNQRYTYSTDDFCVFKIRYFISDFVQWLNTSLNTMPHTSPSSPFASPLYTSFSFFNLVKKFLTFLFIPNIFF